MQQFKISHICRIVYLCFFSCLFLLLSTPSFSQPHQYNNRILVLGGGGARGAWGGGYAQYLSSVYGPYKYAYGTSTGSLLAPLVVLDSFERLKALYTSIDQKKIFNHNPFNKNTGELKWYYAIWRLLIQKKTFGDSKNLRKLMDEDKALPKHVYDKLINSKDSLRYTVSVANMKKGRVEYKCSAEYRNDADMKNWMWASANEPLFMNYYYEGFNPLVKKPCFKRAKKYYGDASYYADGGVIANVPLLEAVSDALENNIYNIDVIINKPVNPVDTDYKNKGGIIKGLERLLTLWETQIRNDNIILNQLESISKIAHAKIGEEAFRKLEKKNVLTITLHFYPGSLYFGKDSINQKELLFNKDRMTKLWSSGEQHIEDVYTETGEKNGHVITIPLQDASLHNYMKGYRIKSNHREH